MICRRLYFLFFLMQSFPGRFVSLFLQAHDLSSSQIGIILSFGNLIALFGTLLFGFISDRSSSRLKVVAILSILSSLSIVSHCLALESVGLISKPFRFPYLLLAYGLFSFFDRPMAPILTAVCVSHLKLHFGANGSSKYGENRVGGTVSWAAGSVIIGQLLDVYESNITFIFVGNVLCTVFFLVFVMMYHEKIDAPSTTTVPLADTLQQNRMKPSEVNEYKALLCDSDERKQGNENGAAYKRPLLLAPVNAMNLIGSSLRVLIFGNGYSGILFFCLLFVLSCGISVVSLLQFLFFYNDLSTSGLICGLSVLVTIGFEIPIFANANQLLQMYGPESIITFGAASYGVRTIGYALVPKGWYVLLLEPLHGVTFSALQTAGVAYVSNFTPHGAEASAQSILTCIRTTAAVLGVSMGGWVMEIADGRVLFGLLGSIVLAVTLMYVLFDRHCRRGRCVL